MNATLTKPSVLHEKLEDFFTNIHAGLTIPIVAFLLAIARCIWGSGDLVGWGSILLVALFAVIMWKSDGVWQTNAFFNGLIVLTPVVSLFWIAAGSIEGYWVNERDKTTTLTSRTIAVTPFQSSVYFVEKKQPQTTKVKVTAADGIPLTCTVHAQGVLLDTSNPKLLRTLLLADSGDPKDRINAALGDELRSAAAAVIGAKPSIEIAQLRQFYIPYHVGSKLGNTLSSLGLRWDEGHVMLSCEVVFTS